MDFKLAVLIVSAQICATLALPPCVCTRNLRPVCGSDGVTYSNQCLLDCAAQTSGTEITTVSNGSCGSPSPVPKTADCVCTFNYNPVCGTDGQTYSNECSLDCQKSSFNPALKVGYSGPCKTANEGCICPEVYQPVCGSDGKTYGNDCELNCAAKDNSMLSIAQNGACVSNVMVVEKPVKYDCPSTFTDKSLI